ncbi:MAG: septum formation initiator family protein [Candidatus Omnitrophica bacterium]|nr:septum formation initiator family protein [Candidatus Omnitrophota bacterium]
MEKKKVTKLFLFLIALVVIFFPGYSKYQELAQKNRELREKIQQLEATNKRFQKELSRLEGDPSYLEKVAREKMRIIKKGEIIYKSQENAR